MTRKNVHGWCNTCQEWFTPDPRTNKQWWCNTCRSQPVNTDAPVSVATTEQKGDLVLKSGFLFELLDIGESVRGFLQRHRLKLDQSTVSYWNVTGRIPGKAGSVERFCRAIGATRKELEQKYGRA